MVTLKTAEEIATLRRGGRRHAVILSALVPRVRPGVTARELDSFARTLIEKGGDRAAFLGYQPRGAKRPYPAALCVSVNNEIVHGIPNEVEKTLREGDIVSLDLGLTHEGLITDAAVTVPVGKVDKASADLVAVTKKALHIGIAAARGGAHVNDISRAIEEYVRPFGYGIVRELAGHGVGRNVHEDPYVPNIAGASPGVKLRPGMVLAIEPMCTLGTADIVLADDGYTYRTADGSRSAHFEHTVLITSGEAEILTIS